MASSIDETKPLDGIPASKSDLRDNLSAAKSEIEALQNGNISIKPFSDSSNIFDGNLLDRSNDYITPQYFAPEGYIGQGAARALSADYATTSDAAAAYPLIASYITDIDDNSAITYDTAALKSMSRFAQSLTNGVAKQAVRAGVYNLSDTWDVLDGSSFATCHVEGAGAGYDNSIKATQVNCSAFLDRPGVSVQSARSCRFENIGIVGGNLAPATAYGKPDVADWLTPGVTLGQYNPYVGFAIDAYTVDPGSGQGYSNLPYGVSAGGSSHVSLSKVQFEYFGLGLGISLSNHGFNADEITMDNCFVRRNAIGVSSGGSQNRILVFDKGYMFSAHTCFDNTRFGNRDGNCWQVKNSTVVLAMNLFFYGAADPAVFEQVHLEQFGRLGTYIGNSQRFPLTFRNCHIKDFYDVTVYEYANRLLCASNAYAEFDSCRFDVASQAERPNFFNLIADRSPLVFRGGCTFYVYPKAVSGDETPLVAFSSDNQVPAIHESSYVESQADSDIEQGYNAYSLNEIQRFGRGGGTPNSMPPRIYANPCTKMIFDTAGKMFHYQQGSEIGNTTIPGLASITLTSTELSFDTTEPEIFFVGDAVAAPLADIHGLGSSPTAPVALVTSISSNTITCSLACDEDEILTPVTSVRLVQSHKEWAPSDPLNGTCSTSSATVIFDLDISEIIKANDWIKGNKGSWTRYRVDSVAGDGLSITLNKNAPTTGLVSLYWGLMRRVDSGALSLVIDVGDEATDLTTGTAKKTFRMPYAMELTEARASVNTAPTGAAIEVDVNEGGASIFSTVLSIDATEKTSTTATAPAVISDTSLADDAEITIDIDQIGSTIAGKGLKVTLIGQKA